jgi:transposase IS116/IS110/IS902 family protein
MEFLDGATLKPNESAGKRKSSCVPKGNVYLKTALVEAANAAALPQT